ncbi:AMP-binding protein [Pseudoalteromonas sp. C2R02]|uniref:AMP-binding protein n=1 Tax=Pseudoalteromonas sp. C2R02 TaxID=2841565 RepID=UPI001C08E4ED|nr:AMP-binding protein [Pseudoalteromonas sp. C2R02]MBU2970276.1 AMP-binding protein [Pseudoalteromonas sp. C2R02]
MSHICFLQGEKEISWSFFCTQVESIRQTIRQTQFENVLLYHSDSYQFSIYFFALMLEQKHILLPPNSQQETLNQISKSADVYMGEISLLNIPKIECSFNNIQLKNSPKLASELFDNFNSKITFYTSGSTGKPKAIVKHSHYLLKEIEILKSTFETPLLQTDIVLSTVSHQHIYGLLFKILLPLRFGIKILNQVFEYPEHIQAYLKANKSKQVTLLASPAHLKRLVEDNVLQQVKAQFECIFSSGGPLAFNVSSLINKQLNIAPTEVFGSTETGGISWRRCDKSTPSNWMLFKGIKYNSVAFEDLGERLQISSPFMAETSYLTDDLIQKVDDTHFVLKGRSDRTIKLEEKRINLEHMEQALIRHAGIKEAKVFILNNSKRPSLVAVIAINDIAKTIICDNNKRALNECFKVHLLKEFERISLPKKWRYLDELPFNAQGKLVQKELEVLFD